MPFKRSPSRSKTSYKKKLNPRKIFIAFEGSNDEKDYFNEIKNSIPNRFKALLELIIVEQNEGDTLSAPQHILERLDKKLRLEKNQIKKTKDLAFLIMDRDRYFSNSHCRATSNVIQQCKQKGFRFLCNTPSFDLWILLHYKDLTIESQSYRDKIRSNSRISNKLTFIKKEVSIQKELASELPITKRVHIALENEKRLASLAHNNQLPNDDVFSVVGQVIEAIIEQGIVID